MTEELMFTRHVYQSGANSLEALILSPKNIKGKLPAVIYVHGMNMRGAWEEIFLGYFLVKAGFVAVLPSQLGFGIDADINKRDFCGPETVQGILDCITSLDQFKFIDQEKLGIWGISRGATVTSQVITKGLHNLKVAVLQSGVYEMQKEYERPDRIPGIKDAMEKETGGGDNAWLKRSSIYQMDKLTTPVLILHGDKDDRVDVSQAEELNKALTKLKKAHTTIILPEMDHYLTKFTRKQYTFPFLKKYLK